MEVRDLVKSVDIVKFVGQFTDGFEERSDGDLWTLSPLKEENTPSFSINPKTQRFYDFSSGRYGDVLDFALYYYNKGFRYAVDRVKEFAGVDGEIAAPDQPRLEATDIARRFRRKDAKQEQTGMKPLPEDHMEQYSDDMDKLRLWIDEGISPEVLREFGVRYDDFGRRIVYPIYDADGNLVNVGARTTVPDWKERGIRKYTYTNKWNGAMRVLYGFFQNRDAIDAKREIILFEGAKSVMKAASWGVRNTAAILTSHMSAEQFKLLLPLGVRTVFALDKDVDLSGDKNVRRLMRYVPCKRICDRDDLLGEKDAPVDRGEEVFRYLYEHAVRMN